MEDQGTMSMRLIESNDLVQMLPSQDRLSLHAKRLPQGPVGFDQQGRVALALGQADELLPKRTRRL
jgi:hypothetical protein